MLSADLHIDIGRTVEGFVLDVRQTLPLDGITVVFGRSGSGKTMLLRAVAGLDRPDRGVVRLGEDCWFDRENGVDLPTHRRQVGFMFQRPTLFPHMNVAGNLAYAEKRAPAGGGSFTRDDVLEATAVGDLLDRSVEALSGGEAQRVALARTLLTRPGLLLLDEPLSAVDRERKQAIVTLLRSVPARFGVPMLYVSHDIDEVLAVADHVVVLAAGSVVAAGPAGEVLADLDLAPIAGRLESGVVVEARVESHEAGYGLSRLRTGDDLLSVPLRDDWAIGDEVRVRIRSRDVAIATEAPRGISIRNVLPATIRGFEATDHARDVEVLMTLSTSVLRARLTRAAVDALALQEGMAVFALIKSVSFETSLERSPSG